MGAGRCDQRAIQALVRRRRTWDLGNWRYRCLGNVGAIQSALNGLANISAGGGSVSVSGVANSGTYTVAFDGGPLAHTDVPLLVASDGTTPLSGEEAGSKVLIQTLDRAGVNRGDEQIGYAATVANTGVDPTSGEVRLEVALPAGLKTSIFAVKGEGWSCEASAASGAQPAHALCTRSTPLSPGASFPPVKLTVLLGSDAPERALATATASCLCAPAAAGASDESQMNAVPRKAAPHSSAAHNPMAP